MDRSERDALLALDAVELRDRLAGGALTALGLAEAVIARIEEIEPQIGAFAWFDAAHLRAQAERSDARRRAGAPLGPLHGLPVAIKDVIDTADAPTQNGAALDAGRRPRVDAAVVARLRAAGALMLGKTTTCELAYLHPTATRNPAAPGRTPGGSSAGSAAAVAAGMAPLALGTQTGGSVIRPASFCGVVGFKPTFGAIARRGVLTQAPSLDTVGVFARDVAGAALLAEALIGADPADAGDARPGAPGLLATALARPPVAPTFAFVETPGYAEADADMRAGFEELCHALGAHVFATTLPRLYDEAATIRAHVNDAEMAHRYRGYADKGWSTLAPETRAAIERGRALSAPAYLAARDMRDVFAAGLDEILERCDAILTPAALGAAPEGLASTGDSIFNGLFTFTGHPAATVPLLIDAQGAPMGVQIVGRRGEDARLLRAARWLETRFAADALDRLDETG